MSDDPNLVSCAGMVPVLAFADSAGLAILAGQHPCSAVGCLPVAQREVVLTVLGVTLDDF